MALRQTRHTHGTFDQADGATRSAQPNLALSGGGSGSGTGGNGNKPNVAPGSPPPPKETLTQKFNRAAKKRSYSEPVSKERIAAYEKMLSKPKLIHAPSPMGLLKGNFDSQRDLIIRETLTAMKKIMAERKQAVKQDFAKASLKNTLKKSFNKSSGISM